MHQLVMLMGIQSFELANKPAFRNCLVTMRPKTTKEDLPSAYDVKAFLRKEFVRHIEGLASEIQVCPGFVAGELWNSRCFRASLDVHR